MSAPSNQYRLYGDHRSGNCYKAALILRLTGTGFEWIETDVLKHETRSGEFLAMNPNGRVPVLVLPDGRILSESNAILIYLAENTPWLPGDAFQRALVYQWLFFEQYSHEPYIAVARFIVHLAKMADEHEKRLEYLWKNGHTALLAMENRLGQVPFLSGGNFTIADIALFAYTHLADEGGFDLQPYPNVRSWLSRVEAQEGFDSMLVVCQ